MIDLIERLSLPCLIVARMRLGTINHTLLSINALTQRAIPIAGIVLSCSVPPAGPEEQYTAMDIAQLAGGIPVLTLPHLDEDKRSDPSEIAENMVVSWPDVVISRLLGHEL
jgi:dethiobiotin synthetase